MNAPGAVTKVLVVDDSALMRRKIAEALGSAGFAVATAADGAAALELLESFDPDVITLDVTMPGMDGLDCLRRIMVERPKPVVMVSSLTTEGAEVTLEAFRLGAVEAVQKPAGPGGIARVTTGLADTVRAAASARLRRAPGLRERLRRTRERIAGQDFAARRQEAAGDADGPGLVIVGVSTGGPSTLEEVLPRLPASFPWPVAVAQHMPAAFTGALARRLDDVCALRVVEVDRTTPLEPGVIHIARGGGDMVAATRAGRAVLMPVPEAAERSWHPSVDRLVESAAAVVPAARTIGVLLTGMGNDGAAGMTALRSRGGRTIAESEDSAVIFGMPQALIRLGGADVVLPATSIAAQLRRWLPAPLHRDGEER